MPARLKMGPDLQRLGPEPGARLQRAPAGRPAVQRLHAHVFGREADGADVRRHVHAPVQPHHGHVEPVDEKF